MKKLKVHILYLVIILIINSCSKSNDNSQSKTSTPTPNNSVPNTESGSIPGIINLSISTVILHLKNQVQITAKVFNSDGSLAMPQPTLNWSSSNPSVASVSGAGLITATSIGEIQITVANSANNIGLVNVSVVSDTTLISNTAANITFDSLYLKGTINSQVGIPSYIITDVTGRKVQATPTFEIDNLSGSLINGTNINLGSINGIGMIKAKVNGKYLSGRLPLIAYDPLKPQTDTVRTITHVSNFPWKFYFYSLIASPIKIEVWTSFKYSTGGFGLNIFTTTPTKTTTTYPAVVGTTTDGLLISKSPGGTPVQFSYKNSNVLTLNTFVSVDFTGSWGAVVSGTQYNFCFTKPLNPGGIGGTSIVYDNGDESQLNSADFVVNYSGGTYVGDGINPSIFTSCSINGGLSVTTYEGSLTSDYFALYLNGPNNLLREYILHYSGNINKIPMDIGGGNLINITNGTGNCSPPLPLDSLARVLESKTWAENDCLANINGGFTHVYVFKTDGTGTTDLTTYNGIQSSFKWSVDTNDVITLSDDGTNYSLFDNSEQSLKFYVSTYSIKNGVLFTKILEHDPLNKATDVIINSGSGGCVLGIK
jgi:hypothetical protein